MSKHKHHGKHEKIEEKPKSNARFIIILVIIFICFYIYSYWAQFSPLFAILLKKIEYLISLNAFTFTLYSHFKYHVIQSTFLGIFYINLFLGLFFIPGPSEIVFIGYLLKNVSPMLLVAMTVLGMFVSQLFNYLFGYLFGKSLAKKLFKDNFTKYSEWINKYGTFFLIIMLIFPFLPSQPASVLYGSLKYSFKKFFIINLIVLLIKFTALAFLFFYANSYVTSFFKF
ncbi:MAG: VTT domain-containing protein [Candidatus Woesearchaeota archaeon]|jgi:membrane protein YqaA with SNARE-associated domain